MLVFDLSESNDIDRKVNIQLLKSLILAQDERWRRA